MNGRYRESGNPIFLFLEFNQKISAKVITLDIILGIAKIHMVVYASCIFFITDIATLYQSECPSVAGLTYLSQLNFIRHFEVKTFSEYLDASSVPLYFAAARSLVCSRSIGQDKDNVNSSYFSAGCSANSM